MESRSSGQAGSHPTRSEITSVWMYLKDASFRVVIIRRGKSVYWPKHRRVGRIIIHQIRERKPRQISTTVFSKLQIETINGLHVERIFSYFPGSTTAACMKKTMWTGMWHGRPRVCLGTFVCRRGRMNLQLCIRTTLQEVWPDEYMAFLSDFHYHIAASQFSMPLYTHLLIASNRIRKLVHRHSERMIWQPFAIAFHETASYNEVGDWIDTMHVQQGELASNG